MQNPAGGKGPDLLPWLKVFLRRSNAKILVREGGKERVKGNEAEERRLSQRKVADSVCDQSCLTKRPMTRGPCSSQNVAILPSKAYQKTLILI